jgi:hypothetical protein
MRSKIEHKNTGRGNEKILRKGGKKCRKENRKK